MGTKVFPPLPTEAMKLLSTTVTSAGATSANIYSIPQNYKTLILSWTFANLSGPISTTMKFNGINSNYSTLTMYYYASNSGVTTGTPTAQTSANAVAAALPGITGGVVNVTIPEYSLPNQYKNFTFNAYTNYMASTGVLGTGIWTGGPMSGYVALPVVDIRLAFSGVTSGTVATIKVWGIN